MAKELGWSQRRLIAEMSIDEIIDWMGYERSISQDFIKQQKEKAKIAQSKEQEAEMIRLMFASF